MNTLISNFLKKGYEPGPRYIMIDEFNYIRGINVNSDYSDGEKELGEACVAYTRRVSGMESGKIAAVIWMTEKCMITVKTALWNKATGV